MLNDETIKPYVEELKALEATIAKDKEQMTIEQRIDDATAGASANNDANTEKVIQCMDENCAKLNPQKFYFISHLGIILIETTVQFYQCSLMHDQTASLQCTWEAS